MSRKKHEGAERFLQNKEIYHYLLLINRSIMTVCSADRKTKYPTHRGMPQTVGSTFFQAQKSIAKIKMPASSQE